MKRFRLTHNVGAVKYLISYHDGVKTHKDGSAFFDIECFKNKKKVKKFTDKLLSDGYTYQ